MEGRAGGVPLHLLRQQPIRLALLFELRFEEERERFEALVEPLHSEVGDA